MNDGVLVEALRARDPGALAALYDTYAESIYRYCRMMLGGPDVAQAALRDTLIAAEALVGALADHESFRPWLYALARGECLRRRTPDDSSDDQSIDQPGDRASDQTEVAPASPNTVPFGAVPFGAVQTGAATSPTGRVTGPASSFDAVEADLRVVARSAASALTFEDREILTLITRHDLSIVELAAVFGAGQRYVEGLQESATDRLRDAITAEILARKSTHGCERAGRLLAGSSGPLAPEIRQRMIKHLARCESCSRHRIRQVSPAKVFGQLPELGLPDTLRVRVLSCFVDPELVPYRRFVAKRVGMLDPSGFPRTGTRREGRLAQAVAGAVATIAAAAAIALVFAQFSGDLSDPVAGGVARRWPVVGGATASSAPSTARPDSTPVDGEPVAQRPPQSPIGHADLAEPVIPVVPAGPVPLPTPAPRPVPPRSAHSSQPATTPSTGPSGPAPTPPIDEPPVTAPGDDTGPTSPSTPPDWPGHQPPPHRPGPWPGHGSWRGNGQRPDHGQWPGRDHQHHRWPRRDCGSSPDLTPQCPSRSPSKPPSSPRSEQPSKVLPRTPSTAPQRRRPHRWFGPDGDGGGDRPGRRGPERYGDGSGGGRSRPQPMHQPALQPMSAPQPSPPPPPPPQPTPQPSPPESAGDA